MDILSRVMVVKGYSRRWVALRMAFVVVGGVITLLAVSSDPDGGVERTLRASCVLRVFALTTPGTDGPAGLCFVDDNRLWVAVGSDGIVEVDTDSGTVLRRLRTPLPAYILRVSPDRRTVYTDSFAGPGIWGVDVATGSVIHHIPMQGRVNDFVVAKSGALFASDATQAIIWQFSGPEMRESCRIEVPDLAGLMVLGAGDGKLYAGSADEEHPVSPGCVYVIDTRQARHVHTIDLEGALALRSLTASRSGEHIYFGEWGDLGAAAHTTIHRLSARTNEVTATYECSNRWVNALAVDEKSGKLFATAHDVRGEILCVVSMADGCLLAELPCGGDFVQMLWGQAPVVAISSGNADAVWALYVASLRSSDE